MLPLVLPLVGSWQWGFAFWSAPVAVIALLVLALGAAPPRRHGAALRAGAGGRTGRAV